MEEKRNNMIVTHGYTLVELLVVTGIIMTLTIGAILFGVRSIEHANVARTLATINEIKRAYSVYRTELQAIPPRFNPLDTNPLIVDPGVPGWKGPYSDEGSILPAHAWKGHIGWHGEGGDCGYIGAPASCPDRDNNGGTDFIIILNDDLPGTPQTNNQGKIPASALTTFDKQLDDGNLGTGRVQGNGVGDFGGLLPTEEGELAIWVF